jgi:Nucleotidyltransferase domain
VTHQYIDELTATYRGIREVWLLGSRVNGTATEASDWDYLVFLDDDRLFSALCQDLRFKRPGIDLLVIGTLGDLASCPWTENDGYTKTLGLGDKPNGIRWRTVSATAALYLEPTDRKSEGPIKMETKFQWAKALRVYPPEM